MKKFSKKRLLAYLKWKENNYEKAFDKAETTNRKTTIFWDLVQTRILINEIDTWEITELNYGKEIDKFV